MRRPSWRLLAVVVVVLAIHTGLLAWWQQARSVSGAGHWQLAASTPLRLRTTVLQPAKPRVAADALPLPQRPAAEGSEPDQPASTGSVPIALPPAGENRPWAPLPSDYLAVEQVDAFPHPQDDWQLDWAQIPNTSVAWRITVRLWVSAAGQIDHVELLDAEPHTDWIPALLKPLARTPMAPAQLAGQAVPVTYVVQMAPDQLQ